MLKFLVGAAEVLLADGSVTGAVVVGAGLGVGAVLVAGVLIYIWYKD
jgi:hypothetical protein